MQPEDSDSEYEIDSKFDFSELKEEKIEKVDIKEKSVQIPHSGNDFLSFNLSRILLKALFDLKITSPMPVQESVLPPALLGKDLLVNAVTGSGKSLAFLLPCIERLIRLQEISARSNRATRILIICPTRELATQLHTVANSLLKYCNYIRCALIVGGLSNLVQSSILNNKPDILFATPGRIIDHIFNTKNFTLDDIEILILDEADKLLSMGFEDEIFQILKYLPKQRQTMLFSATLDVNIKRLASLSLNNPQSIIMNQNSTLSLPAFLTQEFVFVAENNDNFLYRQALVLALCLNSFKSHTLIFCSTKIQTHHTALVLKLCSLKVNELHGNMTQPQREQSLSEFNNFEVDYLCCTDIAARGLDILGLKNVINMYLPKSLINYIHRVGRTARAGKEGRAISFITAYDNKLVQEIIKLSPTDSIMKREVGEQNLDNAIKRIESLKSEIKNLLKEEKEEKAIRILESKRDRLENLVLHEEDILNRPRKEWFLSSKEKKKQKDAEDANEGDESDDQVNKDQKEQKQSKGQKIKVKKQQKQTSNRGQTKINSDQVVQKASKRNLKNPRDKRNVDDKLPKRRRYTDGQPENDSFDKRYASEHKKQADIIEKKLKPAAVKQKGSFKSKKRYKRRKY